jgi:HK97 family phage prohead protease
MKKETRTIQVKDLRVERRDGMKPKIVGYAAVFDKLSSDLGGFVEKIKRGAFKEALKRSDPRGLFNHDPNYVLGRMSSGTLKLEEKRDGLWMEIEPPDTQLIRDMVLSPIERGDVNQQSFAFMVEEDEWENVDEKSKGPIVRTIKKVFELFDVSPVTYPAYPDTSVALRSLDAAKEKTLAFKEATLVDKLRHLLDNYKKDNTADHLRDMAEIIDSELKISETDRNGGEDDTDETERNAGESDKAEGREILEAIKKLETTYKQ